MDRHPLRRKELVVCSFTNERMPERVTGPGIADMHQDTLVDRLSERGDEVRRRRPGDPLEQFVADHSPGDRRHAHDPLRRLVEGRQARGQDLSERRGQWPATHGTRCDELLGKEGIPVRSGEHLMRDLRIRNATQDPGQLLDELAFIEARKVDLLEPGQAGKLRHDPQDRVPPMQRVDARGRDQ